MNKTELAKLLVEKAQALMADEAKPAPAATDAPLTREEVGKMIADALASNAQPADAKPEGADKADLEAAIKDLLPAIGAPAKGNGLDHEAVSKMTPQQINENWEAVSAAISK